MLLFCILLICMLSFPSCVKNDIVNHDLQKVNDIEIEAEIEEIVVDHLLEQSWEIVSSMDNRLLVSQILISGIDSRGTLSSGMKTLLKDIPAGGIMLFRFNLNVDSESNRVLVSDLVSQIKNEIDIPPFIAIDHEGGTVYRFFNRFAYLPNAISYYEIFQEHGRLEALAKIEEDSLISGREINSLGFNMNFAPIAEYLIKDNYDFLQYRSYGPDPVFTAQAAIAFTRGMEQAGVLCVAKHFPGSAGPDPHYSASVLTKNKSHLDFFVSPFSALINNGARAIMIAHTAAPAVDTTIASLSSAVMQTWLRDELGFTGLIITDDFTMAAAGNIRPEEAAVQSVIAGADMVLVWPAHLRRTHTAFITALENGRLSPERLQDAALRVVYEKLRMGLLAEEETVNEYE